MLKDHVDEDGEAHLERIIDSVNHVEELTKTSREFIDSIVMNREPAIEPVNLKRFFEEEVEKACNKFTCASFEVDDLPTATVQANKMLSSVFRNILNNAVRHNDERHPEVRISAETDGEDGCITVRIADNGPGIPTTGKKRSSARRAGLESKGTGIGLYLVDTLVDQFGGEIWVEDNDPKGAVFKVTLRTD